MCIIGSEHTHEQHTRESKERQAKQEKQTASPSYIPYGLFFRYYFLDRIPIYIHPHTKT